MAEYIEREATYTIAKKICDAIRNGEYHSAVFAYDIMDWIDDVPAADVVPVVQCRDCKHGTRLVCDLAGNEYIECRHGNIPHRLDWFCADGAKKDGEV